MDNPLLTDQPFSLTLANPNPSARKTKGGPVYRVTFELTPEEHAWFMECETTGMVLECQASVAHRNTSLFTAEVAERTLPVKSKLPAIVIDAVRLCQEPKFWRFADSLGYQQNDNEEGVSFARRAMLAYCGIPSRKELAMNTAAVVRFKQLYRMYSAYLDAAKA